MANKALASEDDKLEESIEKFYDFIFFEFEYLRYDYARCDVYEDRETVAERYC